jgi:DNA sulfur modification protein DndE
MIPDIRLSQQAKEQLIRLKRVTGLKHWNALCRWALCTSLADPSPVAARKAPSDSSVEMSWKVFGGAWAEVYEALLRARCERDGVSTEPESLSRQLRLHIHRGIGAMTADKRIRDIGSLLERALP